MPSWIDEFGLATCERRASLALDPQFEQKHKREKTAHGTKQPGQFAPKEEGQTGPAYEQTGPAYEQTRSETPAVDSTLLQENQINSYNIVIEDILEQQRLGRWPEGSLSQIEIDTSGMFNLEGVTPENAHEFLEAHGPDIPTLVAHLKSGKKVPPIVVHRRPWFKGTIRTDIIDGEHRAMAAAFAGVKLNAISIDAPNLKQKTYAEITNRTSGESKGLSLWIDEFGIATDREYREVLSREEMVQRACIELAGGDVALGLAAAECVMLAETKPEEETDSTLLYGQDGTIPTVGDYSSFESPATRVGRDTRQPRRHTHKKIRAGTKRAKTRRTKKRWVALAVDPQFEQKHKREKSEHGTKKPGQFAPKGESEKAASKKKRESRTKGGRPTEGVSKGVSDGVSEVPKSSERYSVKSRDILPSSSEILPEFDADRVEPKPSVRTVPSPPPSSVKTPSPLVSLDEFNKAPTGRDRESARSSLSSRPIAKYTPTGAGVAGTNSSYFVETDDGERGVWKPSRGESEHITSIPKGTAYRREIANSNVADVIGYSDLVPVTVEKSIGDDGVGSVQHYSHGAVSAKKSPDMYDGDKDLARAAAFDYLMGNVDRHSNNWMVSQEGKLVLIDNGFSLPLGDLETEMQSALKRLETWGSYHPDYGKWAGILWESFNRGLPLPDLSSWDWSKIEPAMRRSGIEYEAISSAKARYETLKSAPEGSTFASLIGGKMGFGPRPREPLPVAEFTSAEPAPLPTPVRPSEVEREGE